MSGMMLFTCGCLLVLALTGVLLPCSLSCMQLTEVVMLGVEETDTLESILAATHTEISWTCRAFKLRVGERESGQVDNTIYSKLGMDEF